MESEQKPDLKPRADGKTAFVLGNGPSLASVSLPALSDYATIGMNAAYRYWREIDWRPRYYACVDLVVGMSHKDEIAALIEEGRIGRFLLRSNLVEALGSVAATKRVVNFDAERHREPLLSLNPPTTGSHSALWAGAMGYAQIVMLGVDAQYKEIVEGAKKKEGIELEIVEERDNPNYFFKGYQAAGDRYNIPNPRPDLHVNAWRIAGAHLKAAGISVFNGNPASAVECFPTIDLDRFLGEGDAPKPAKEALPPVSPKGGQGKLARFLGRYGVMLAFSGAALFAGLAAWVAFAVPSTPSALAGVVLCGVLFMIIAALIYFRHVILRQLHHQEERLDGIAARLADLERLSD